MKQRIRKLFSLVAAGVLAATLFATPASTADRVEDGNAAFDRWAAEAAIAERQRMEQLTGLPEDPQAAFEEAAAILEAIENARAMTHFSDDNPALIDRDGEPLENETPEKLWAEFIAQFGGGSELSDEEEFPYELRFFTVAGEERFAIYDTRSGRAAAGWQGSTGKWWYSYGDGTWASGWTTINGLDYYFDPNNNDYMVHGWLDDEDSYSQYFMGTPGQMDSGAKYTFGWLNDKEAGGTDAKPIWYYFQSSGAMRHGWLTYKGDRYYMGVPGKPKTGVMYDKGWLTEYGDTYYIGSDGIAKIGRHYIDYDYYVFGDLGKKMIGWYELNNEVYYLSETGAAKRGYFNMSPYVQSRFNSYGVLVEDIMLEKEQTGAQKDAWNVRLLDTVIENGYRKANAKINYDYLSESFVVYAKEEAAYFSTHSDNTIKMYETSRDESNIDLSMDNFDAIGGNILGMTLSKNSEDEWLFGKSLTSDTDNVFSIGFITYSIVLIHPKTVDSLSASEKEYLIRHETGHAVGLRHPCEVSELELQDTLEKCLMFPVLSKPGDEYYPYFSTSLKSYDLEELRKTYPN